MSSRTRLHAELLRELTASRGTATSRNVEMHVRLAVADFDEKKQEIRASREVLLDVGGLWNRRLKYYDEGCENTVPIVVHRGQEEPARWLVEWLKFKQRGDRPTTDYTWWSSLLIGGRRSGKSHLGGIALVLHAVMMPESRAWAVSSKLSTGAELESLVVSLMPRAWYSRRELETGAAEFTLINGSTITLRSGFKASSMKAGRVDLALVNEGQMMSRKVYENLRGAVIDRSGVVLVTANPPDEPIGRWVEDHFNSVRSGHVKGVAFQLDPRLNPFVEYVGLAAMASEMDEKSFQRDVLGMFPPIGDVVFHAWSDWESWRDPPPNLVDITAEVSRRELGRAAGDIVGMDFQLTPAMVAIVHRVFRDPTTGDELLWVVDEFVVPEASEDHLVDALEAAPRWRPGDGIMESRVPGPRYHGSPTGPLPTHAACIIDASGFYQDGAHTQGRTSDRFLKARRWDQLFKPQKDSDRNPAVLERMKTGNMLLRSANGTRRLFVARHCIQTAKALRNYENKNGVPNRHSGFAHIVDGVTYVSYRLYGRPKVKGGKAEYISGGKFEDRGMGW